MTAAIHIRFTRSGGFAGLRAVADVDMAALAHSEPDRARELGELAQTLLTEPAPEPEAQQRADGFQYDVEIQRAGEQRNIQAAEPVSNPALRRLIELCDDLAATAH